MKGEKGKDIGMSVPHPGYLITKTYNKSSTRMGRWRIRLPVAL